MTTIHGEKITLRPYRMSDADVMLVAFRDEESNRLTGTHATFTLEQIQRYIANFDTAEDRVGFVIGDPATDDLAPLGEVVINYIDTANRSASIRIALYDMAKAGKGIGTEAMRLAVNYAFTQLKLHRLELEVYDFNPRAIRVYEKVGFQREGVRRDALLWDGEFQDAIVMSILEDEWRA